MARSLSVSKVLVAIVVVHLFVIMVLPTIADAKPKKGKKHPDGDDLPKGEDRNNDDLEGGGELDHEEPPVGEPKGLDGENGPSSIDQGSSESLSNKAPVGFDEQLYKRFLKIHELIEMKIGSTGVSEDEDFDMFREYLEARRVLAEKKYNKDGKKSDKDKDKDVKKVKKGKGKKDKNGKKGEDSDDSGSNSKSDSDSSMDDMDLSLDFDPEIYKQYLDARNYMDKKDSNSKIPEGIDYLLFSNYLKKHEQMQSSPGDFLLPRSKPDHGFWLGPGYTHSRLSGLRQGNIASPNEDGDGVSLPVLNICPECASRNRRRMHGDAGGLGSGQPPWDPPPVNPFI